MRALLISERAEADLRDIWRWTGEQFGEAQADRYLDGLERGLREVGTEPDRGKRRDAVRPGYWSKHVHRHVVFYVFTQSKVVIQRVLHGSMDPQRHV